MDVVSEKDTNNDGTSGGGVRLSMSDGGRARSSIRRIQCDVASSGLDGRRPIMKVGNSHAKSASKP